MVNNAGVITGLNVEDQTDAMIDKTIRVNTISHLFTIQEFLPAMIAQKRGHIVTIASIAGLVGVNQMSDYVASKHGAVAIDESVRLEIRAKGHSSYVKTTCICPYLINTGMFEGAGSNFPFWMQDAQRVTDRIIAAVRQEEAFVVLPWRGNIV